MIFELVHAPTCIQWSVEISNPIFLGRAYHRSLSCVSSRSQEDSKVAHAGERRVVNCDPQNDDTTKLFQLAQFPILVEIDLHQTQGIGAHDA